MNNCIAVFLEDNNKLVPFLEANQFMIFTKDQNAWVVTDTVLFDSEFSKKMNELRQQIKDIINQLGDCRIIAGIELSGIPYSEFDKSGFDIFLIECLDDTVLNGIIKDIEKGNALTRMKAEIINNACPVETATPGIYFLDLITLQTECPEISSKKAMKDFFDRTAFLELHLVCKHIPQWIENGCFDIKQAKTADGDINAVITKRQC